MIAPTAPATTQAAGVVIDSLVDKKQGIMTTLLVQQGSVKVGDVLVAGSVYAKVKRILDDSGTTIKSAGPSTPVQVSCYNNFHKSYAITTQLQRSFVCIWSTLFRIVT